jgi:hypothetical protein
MLIDENMVISSTSEEVAKIQVLSLLSACTGENAVQSE